mmetsp:Transcript_113176/g.315106  ORF Transcript_113176/g.315106 Transcript_113176/m.315106 type:complete len:234 (-) Transcript_113176:1346-2047(-)
MWGHGVEEHIFLLRHCPDLHVGECKDPRAVVPGEQRGFPAEAVGKVEGLRQVVTAEHAARGPQETGQVVQLLHCLVEVTERVPVDARDAEGGREACPPWRDVQRPGRVRRDHIQQRLTVSDVLPDHVEALASLGVAQVRRSCLDIKPGTSTHFPDLVNVSEQQVSAHRPPHERAMPPLQVVGGWPGVALLGIVQLELPDTEDVGHSPHARAGLLLCDAVKLREVAVLALEPDV